MKHTLSAVLFVALVLIILGCGQQIDTTDYTAIEPPSPFLAGLQSYQSINDVQKAFTSKGFKWKLKGRVDCPMPKDKPPYNVVIMFVDEFTALGHQGELILHFSNNRLQRMCFTPETPAPFFTALEDKVGQALLGIVRIKPYTELQKHTLHDGRDYANWEDTRLAAQQDNWLDLYSRSD